MYLFVFIWVPTLQESSLSPSSLPLGYIFSAFMVSMMLGSLLYTYITAHWYPPSTSSGLQKHARSTSVGSLSSQGDSSLVLHAQLSSLVCAAAAVTFAACVRVGKGKGEEGEHLKFWAFCLFEACVGMYYPVQGMLRGSLISNEHRATVSPFVFGAYGQVLRVRYTAFCFISRTAEHVRCRVAVDGSVVCP
jgi:MFS transporter, MFS domain-containing protein family, molybdate-anion transporter